MSRPRICITTYFDRRFAAVGSLCLTSLEHYADRHGYRVLLHNDATSGRPPAWNKILVLKRVLDDESCDFVLWVDADAVFARYDVDIAREIQVGRDLYLVKHDFGGREKPNTGLMLLRNSSWARSFLGRTWDMTEYIYHPWWENAAVMDLLGYGAEIDRSATRKLLVRALHGTGTHDVAVRLRRRLRSLLGSRQLANRSRVLQDTNLANIARRHEERVKWLDVAWNVFAETRPHDRAIVHHYPARSLAVRQARMRADLERSGLRCPGT